MEADPDWLGRDALQRKGIRERKGQAQGICDDHRVHHFSEVLIRTRARARLRQNREHPEQPRTGTGTRRTRKLCDRRLAARAVQGMTLRQ